MHFGAARVAGDSIILIDQWEPLIRRRTHLFARRRRDAIGKSDPLQQRSRWKDRHPLKWDSSAAGHVTAGESYNETARRELKEELGVDVPLEKVFKLAASARTDHEFICGYCGVVSEDLAPNKCEIESGVFFAPAVIDGWTSARPDDFAPGFLECWKAYRKMHSGCEGSIHPETFSAANGAASTA